MHALTWSLPSEMRTEDSKCWSDPSIHQQVWYFRRCFPFLLLFLLWCSSVLTLLSGKTLCFCCGGVAFAFASSFSSFFVLMTSLCPFKTYSDGSWYYKGLSKHFWGMGGVYFSQISTSSNRCEPFPFHHFKISSYELVSSSCFIGQRFREYSSFAISFDRCYSSCNAIIRL